MTKRAGRKSIKDSNLPDPFEWKYCKHPGCRENIRQFDRYVVREEEDDDLWRSDVVWMLEGKIPLPIAVFLEDYCWEHLNEKAKSKYKERIEKWIEKGHSLERANLQKANLRYISLEKANLQEAELLGADLEGANLKEANLQGAHLLGANLDRTYLRNADLQEADLSEANLRRANLSGADLQKTNLQEADLYKATLEEANLKEADLSGAVLDIAHLKGANLQGAELHSTNLLAADFSCTNLQEATLEKAKLQAANLSGADLQKANLQEANLQGVKLQGACLILATLSDVNLQKAELKETYLHLCYMHGVLLEGTTYLTWGQVLFVMEEKDGMWELAQDAYRRLKNYFHQQGQYGDESNAYYREKLMAKHQAHEELFGKSKRFRFNTAKRSWKRFYVWILRGSKRAFQNIGRFFVHNENKGVRRHWFGLWFMWVLAGFGERWSRTVSWAAGTFAFFGLLHWLGTNAGWWQLMTHNDKPIKHLLDCLYFSLVTFVTLGFGDIWPASWLPKIIVGIEVVFGYVFLGLLVTLIARKMGR